MFEKFTERARRAIFFARAEVEVRRAWAIEPEHLLLGLLREDPELFQLLSPDGKEAVSVIRNQIEASIRQSDTVQSTEHIPLSPFGKEVVRMASDSSRGMGHAHVGTQHLLLALIRQGLGRKRRWFSFAPRVESLVSRILRERGLTEERVASKVLEGSITPQTLTGASASTRPPSDER